MESHSIHRLHEFLPHMARRQPRLLSLLPAEERPQAGAPLSEWVLSLPQRRLMEICSSWVLESLRRLRTHSPLSNVLIRGALHFSGEFDLADVAAVAIGAPPAPSDPRREELRNALFRATRLGILIHLPRQQRFCVPFPVRLSFEGVSFIEPIEREAIRLRMAGHFASMAEDFFGTAPAKVLRHWRFANLLAAYETAAELAEEYLGLEPDDWAHEPEAPPLDLPRELAFALTQFGRALGRSLIQRPSESGARLLAASAAAARMLGTDELHAEARARVGQFHLRRRQFTEAIASYRHAERCSLEAGDPKGALLAISAMALAHREMGNPAEAVAEFLRAGALARENELLDSEVDTVNCAVEVLLAGEQYSEARELAESLLRSRRVSALRCPAFAELFVRLGVALRHAGDYTEARDRLYAAMGFARECHHRPAEAGACLELALVYRAEGDSTAAMKWCRRARNLYAELSDGSGLAETSLLLSQLARDGLDGGSAEEMLAKALRYAQGARDMALVARIWRERGLLTRQESPNSAAALPHFHQEVKALRHTRQPRLLVEAHLRLADLYFAQEAMLAAGTEVLRAQAVARSSLHGQKHPALERSLAKALRYLTPEQFEFLVQEVTEELDTGALGER